MIFFFKKAENETNFIWLNPRLAVSIELLNIMSPYQCCGGDFGNNLFSLKEQVCYHFPVSFDDKILIILSKQIKVGRFLYICDVLTVTIRVILIKDVSALFAAKWVLDPLQVFLKLEEVAIVVVFQILILVVNVI